MQETATKTLQPAVELQGRPPVREACYLDGQWLQAKSGAAINVDTLQPGEIIAACRNWGGAETKQRLKRRIAPFRLEQKKQRKSAPLFCAAGSICDGEPGGIWRG